MRTKFTSYSFYFSFLNDFFDVWGFSGLLSTIYWSTRKAKILIFSRNARLLAFTIIFLETYEKEGKIFLRNIQEEIVFLETYKKEGNQDLFISCFLRYIILCYPPYFPLKFYIYFFNPPTHHMYRNQPNPPHAGWVGLGWIELKSCAYMFWFW